MRVLDADSVLTVAHHVDSDQLLELAQPDPVGLRLTPQPKRRRPSTRCGLDVGPTWVAADRYDVPDCGDCDPTTIAYEQPSL